MLIRSLKLVVGRLVPRRLRHAIRLLGASFFRLPDRRFYEESVAGKCGIEIGGPSSLFGVDLGLYQSARSVDGVNFSTTTIWEGELSSGQTYNYFGRKVGRQFISDATDLSEIADESYDFLISSNCLEHVANPLKALFEWKRVVAPGGSLILVLPNKISNFDHNRDYTLFSHILDDFKSGVTEHDLTHLDEILERHDLSMDPPAGTLEQFRTRSLDNFNNRTLHHHVFNHALVTAMVEHAGMQVVRTSETAANHFALIARP